MVKVFWKTGYVHYLDGLVRVVGRGVDGTLAPSVAHLSATDTAEPRHLHRFWGKRRGTRPEISTMIGWASAEQGAPLGVSDLPPQLPAPVRPLTSRSSCPMSGVRLFSITDNASNLDATTEESPGGVAPSIRVLSFGIYKQSSPTICLSILYEMTASLLGLQRPKARGEGELSHAESTSPTMR